MYISIQDNETIGSVRRKFSEQFPFLRIDFFRALAGDTPYSALRVADEEVELGSIRRQHNTGKLEIKSSMTTKEAEEKFLREFGLHMQIFRRSGNKWLITSQTDDYTLEKQNSIGEEMSKDIPRAEPMDVHEMD